MALSPLVIDPGEHLLIGGFVLDDLIQRTDDVVSIALLIDSLVNLVAFSADDLLACKTHLFQKGLIDIHDIHLRCNHQNKILNTV